MSVNFGTVEWGEGSNIYEVNIRQYTPEGTFNAFAEHLSRLRSMGVEILWFMPVTPVSILNRKGSLGSYYAVSSYTDLNPEFGTSEDFKNLIEQAHKLGLKVIIDWVANHTGWDHAWTKKHPEWYRKDEKGNFTELHGWDDVIDLDYDHRELRIEMINSMQHWITEFDVDGFRCDMAHLVPLDFWLEARRDCDAIKPLYWLAECEEVEYHAAFDATYAWEWMHVSAKFVKEIASIQHFKAVLQKYEQYPKGAQKLLFTSNHDENSWNGTEYEKYGEAAEAMAVFTCTWPGIPLVYSGQELPNLKRLAFFDKDLIEWNNRNPGLHNFYKNLLNLRSNNSAFRSTAGCTILETNDDRIFVYLLSNKKDVVLVVINLSPKSRVKCTILNKQLEGNYINVFSKLEHLFTSRETFELQAWEYFVYEKVSM
jgi:glycosidase